MMTMSYLHIVLTKACVWYSEHPSVFNLNDVISNVTVMLQLITKLIEFFHEFMR